MERTEVAKRDKSDSPIWKFEESNNQEAAGKGPCYVKNTFKLFDGITF